jgi:Peptidase family M48
MRWSLTIAVLLCVIIPVPAEDITIHGFVTDIKSPTRFVIDDYKVIRDSALLLDVNGPEGVKPITFRPEDIHVGTELEVKGEYSGESGQLKAKSIKVFLEDAGIVKRAALLEKIPDLKKEGSGWSGEIRADGERIRVLPTASITIKPNKSEYQKLTDGAAHKASQLTTLDALNLDTFVRYEGTRNVDGKIDAAKIEFEHAELEPGEARLWKRLEPEVRPPDYSNLEPGEFKTRGCFYQWCTQQIVPSKEAQDYIEKIGQSLIPPHQKELAEDDPLKIPFRFYLVKAKSFNAVAYPNGVVLVHSAVFDILQNEAQLAFVLAHEISHAVEKHAWLVLEYHRKQLIALRNAGAFVPLGGSLVAEKAASGIPNEYLRSLENQADRVGLAWMLAAGYDLREAPASWKAVSVKKEDEPVNLLWSNHESKTTRRSYLMAELRNSYFDVDFSKLKKDSKEFHHIAEVVKQLEVKDKRTKAE